MRVVKAVSAVVREKQEGEDENSELKKKGKTQEKKEKWEE